MNYLNSKELAELKGCSLRYIQNSIKKGQIKAVLGKNPITNRKEYRICVDALSDELRDKYYKSINQTRQVFKDDSSNDEVSCKYGRDKNIKKKSYSDFSESEREEIDFWIDILKYWRTNREVYKNKAVADRDIIGAINLRLVREKKDICVTSGQLYRKWSYYENNDLEGLIDKRGGHNKGQSNIAEPIWNGFLNFYLDDRKIPFSEVYRNTIFWAKEFYPDLVDSIPSEMTFRRRYRADMLYAVEVYKRDGLKALLDRCIPYVDRLYDDLKANDVWIVDNHTLDIQSKNDEGSIHRLSITAFMDAKSGIITGFNVTDNPSMNSTIFALRCGIIRFGKPKAILADNGSEFLTYDFAGRGIRKKNINNVIDEYSTILGRLDIDFYTAKVKNAKAKNVERFFLDFKNHISKSFGTYTGGNVLERPESLKMQIKNGLIPTDSRIRSLMDDMIMLENMNEYGGKDKLKYKGLSKMDVYNLSIKETIQVLIPEKDLDLYLMRVKNLQKVGRNGVYIKVAGEKLWYNCEDYWQYMNKKVMVRYNPTDLSTVRVYDDEDRYIGTWELERQLYLSFLESDIDKIADANEKIAKTTKSIKEYAKNMLNLSAETKIDILDLKIKRAMAEKDGYLVDRSGIIKIQSISEKEIKRSVDNMKKTGTDGAVIIDINKMNRNAERNRNS